VAGDAVYSAGRDGTLARLDAASGAVRWRASAERRLSAGVGSDGRIAAVATEDGEVIAFDAASGALRWRARVSSEVLAAPAVGGGLVLVRSVDNRIFAFAEEDGKRRWVYQRAPASLIVRSPAGMTVLGDTAFAGFSGGKLAAIALSNGGVRWEATVASPKGATELERVTDVVGEPVVQGREVCAAAYQGRVACYDLTSGRQIWARDVSSLTGVSFDARYALVSDDRDAVHALDRTNGRSVWKQDRLTHRRLSRPASAGAAVAVGDLEGYVHFLARDSGAFIARYSTGGGAVRAAPVNLPSGLLVQTQNGTLVALGL
jgi:outer membrane protein assembly factor BamB